MPAIITGGQTGTVGLINTATVQNSTSGTAINFTGIPSGSRRVTVLGAAVSTNGTSSLLIQIGDGSISTSGYVGGNFGNTNTTNTSTAGAVLLQSTNTATSSFSFAITISMQTANTWIFDGTVARNDGAVWFVSSYKTLTGALDRVRVTTVNGTDTFDAGTINILYE